MSGFAIEHLIGSEVWAYNFESRDNAENPIPEGSIQLFCDTTPAARWCGCGVHGTPECRWYEFGDSKERKR